MGKFLNSAVLLAALVTASAQAGTCPAGLGGAFTKVVQWSNQLGSTCLVDANIAGKYELYSAPLVGHTVRISQDLSADRDVIAFETSPDSTRVAYTADVTSWTKYDLYITTISGGTPKQMNNNLQHENDVDGFTWSPDSQWIVWRQGRNTTGWWELYSRPVPTGIARRISQEMPIGQGVQWNNINKVSFASLDRVRYLSDAWVDETYEWSEVNVNGTNLLTEIFADGFESGGVTRWN